MNVERIALIGLGSIGRRHLRNIKMLRPSAEVTLVRSGKGRDWPELEQVERVVYSVQEAVDAGVQVAIIASPATLHVQQAIIFARAGVHLLIEKPLSHEVEGVEELLSVVKGSGVVGLTGYVLRYDPVAQAFKTFLKEGRLGKLLHVKIETGSYLPDWRPGQDYKQSVSASKELGGGVLLELSHELDYIRWFFGEIHSCISHLSNSQHLGIDVEECADIIFADSHGLPISVHLNFFQRHPMRRCVVTGGGGTATWDAIANQIIWEPAEGEATIQQFDVKRDALFQAQLEHFMLCVECGTPPISTLEDGLEVLKLVEAVRRSNATGKKQELI